MKKLKETQALPKRGRKALDTDKYIEQTEKKIRAIKALVEKNPMTQAERKKLNNKASALQSRLNKRKEALGFKNEENQLKHQFGLLTQIWASEMSTAQRNAVMKRLGWKENQSTKEDLITHLKHHMQF